MKYWCIVYTKDHKTFQPALIEAETYTQALIQFAIEYPDCIYTTVNEVV